MLSTASDTIMISGTSVYPFGSSLHAFFPLAHLLPTKPVCFISWWRPNHFLTLIKIFLAHCGLFASSFSFWYMLLAYQLQGFFLLFVFHFLYFCNDFVLQSIMCSTLYFELAFNRTLEYFLSFVQHLYFLTCVLPSSFQLRQTFQLRIPPGPAGNT